MHLLSVIIQSCPSLSRLLTPASFKPSAFAYLCLRLHRCLKTLQQQQAKRQITRLFFYFVVEDACRVLCYRLAEPGYDHKTKKRNYRHSGIFCKNVLCPRCGNQFMNELTFFNHNAVIHEHRVIPKVTPWYREEPHAETAEHLLVCPALRASRELFGIDKP